MTLNPTRCLLLACGNPLRGDDGIGPHLALWAQNRFSSQPDLHILARQQWTPELAEDIAHAESVLFLDCSIQSPPGAVSLEPAVPAAEVILSSTHQLGPAELLALARDLYQSEPRQALLLTMGAGSLATGEIFSAPVQAALPEVTALLEKTVLKLLTPEGSAR